jgi:hypothetical protein
MSIMSFNKKGISKAILYLLVAALPFVWYFGAANHSYDHNWFTYRIQAISISGVLLAINNLIHWEKLKTRLRKKMHPG